MKEENFCWSRKNKFFLYLRKIICYDRKIYSDPAILESKLRNISIFYFILIFISLVNIFLYLNSDTRILEQSPKSYKEGHLNFFQNSTHGAILKKKIKFKQNLNLPNIYKYKRELNNQNNITDLNFSLNQQAYSGKSNNFILSRMLFIIIFLKILITLGFVIFYYIKDKRLKSFSKKKFKNDKLNFPRFNIIKEKKYKYSNHNNNQTNYNIKLFHQSTLENLKNNNNFNNVKLLNDETQSKLIKKLLLSKITLINCISFLNSFNLTLQFLMSLNWLRNYNTNTITESIFNTFNLTLMYSAIFCFYFNLLDVNVRIYLLANFIDCLLIGILEKLKLINISFFNNVVFLLIFWIIIFFVIKKINNYEINIQINLSNSQSNNEKEKGSINMEDAILIVYLKEDKSEIIKKESKQYFIKSFNKNKVEKVISFSEKFIEDCKKKEKQELKSIISNSVKNNEKQITKENEILNPINHKNIDKNKTYINDDYSAIKNNNKVVDSDCYLNHENEINLNLFEYEKLSIDSKKKFIFNNLNFFNILLEINDFNFNLSEELIDCYGNILKHFKKYYQISNNNKSEILSENVRKAENQNNEEIERSYFNNKIKNDENFINQSEIKLKEWNNMSSFKKIRNENPNEKEMESNLRENNLMEINTDNNLLISKNNFEIFKNKDKEKTYFNNYNSQFKIYQENAIQNMQEILLIDKLINLFKLIYQEAIKANCSVFLGIMNTLHNKSDKDFYSYGVNVIITENKNFLILKINEIKDEVKFIEMKSEFKYINLYLKKFCHEFKNPLLNILQIIKNSKQNLKSFSKDNISALSKNIHLSQQTSNFSNISNNNLNRKTFYKISSKNVSELNQNNKSSRSNQSPISGEFYNQIEQQRSRNNNIDFEMNPETYSNSPYLKLKIENESNSSKSNQNRHSMNLSNRKNLNVKQISSCNLEEENMIVEFQNNETIKFICDSLILVISDLEFLIEFSNKNIKKLEDLYQNENLSNLILENELFGLDLIKETYDPYNLKEIVKDDHQFNKNETNFDVFKLIKDLTRIYETKINLIGKKITLFSNVQACIPEKIIFDEKKLKQIIFNLLSNALKFSSFGKIGIIVEYNRESKNLVFYITDNGIGISSEIINKIGEPYFKTKNNNNDFGIGMGIYLVKKLVQSLNGEFKIESDINKGTKIILEFPYDLDAKNKTYEEFNQNLEIKLSKFKTPTTSMINSSTDQETIVKKNFKNTEFNFNCLNNLKFKYDIFNKDYFQSNNYEFSIHKKDNKNLNFKENFRQNSHRENTNICKYYTEKFLFNSDNFNNEDYEDSDYFANKSTTKNINQNITFDMRNITCLNINFGNYKQNEKLENLKKMNKRIFKSFIGNKYPLMSPPKNFLKRCLTSKTINVGTNNINGNVYDFKIKNSDISLTNGNQSFNKVFLNPYYNTSSNNLYFVNNITNDEGDKFNLSIENSSGGETVIINDSLINKNLNSLKKEQEIVFRDIHINSKNENFKRFELNSKDCSTPKINSLDNEYYYNERKLFKSGKTSNFESNLELNNVSPKNFNRVSNENESNSVYFITEKRKSTNDILKIDYTDLGPYKKKNNQQENLTLTIGSEISNKDNNLKEIFNSDFSGKFHIEKSKGMFDSDISSKLLNEKTKGKTNTEILSKFNNEKGKRIYNSDMSNKSQIEKLGGLNKSDSSSNIHIERDRGFHYSEITKNSQFVNKFKALDSITQKESLNLTKENFLDEEHLIIFNENKNTKNLYVIIKNGEMLYCHLLHNNSIIENNYLKENFILKSSSLNDLKMRIPNFDVNRSCIINKENINNICNIIERKNINQNMINCERDVLRILIVDDERLIRQSQKNLIKKYSEKKNILIEIEECEDGIECLYKIYKGLQIGKKYNLIITDETMNFLKGSFMAKIMKKLIAEDVIYKIKIIMVTSYGTENYSHLKGTIIEKIYSKPISLNIIDNIFNS